jgi:GNAT superfamily N-acetyltransferase
MSELHLLQASDIPAAMRLVEAAHWNQTAADWARTLSLAPDTCWGIFADGELAATTTAVRYSNGVVWIGMVLTAPAYRGRGYATRLLEEALGMEATCFRLDATAMGAPLYRKLNFVDEQPIERWERPRAAVAYDARLLAALAGAGPCVGRPGRLAWYFGPWVGPGLETALQLTISRRGGEAICWDLFPSDAEALTLAERYGFERRRELVRMRRGPFVPDVPARAICGFEFG